jgi:hypothetical protein
MLLMSGEFQGSLGEDLLQLSRIAAQLPDLSAGRRRKSSLHLVTGIACCRNTTPFERYRALCGTRLGRGDCRGTEIDGF